ncbi:MAG: LysR family transcriptional regulator [Gammaproteobacteria bacterium]|nr:LysR family transcriptional regulator [Gammaproteobacteria bacterium]
MDWDDLRYFYAIARAGSIRGAAAKLKVNHSTVLRRITAFEEKLGVRLFDRLPTGYVMTLAGEDILGSAERIDEEVAAIDRRVYGRDAELSGELRVTIPNVLASHLVMPIFADFTRAYPGIELDVAVSVKTFNLTKREADVAIRVTDKPPEHLIGRRLFQYGKSVYASESYLADHDLDKPENYCWIGWEDDTSKPWWVKESDFSTVPLRHKINNEYAQLAAAKAGMGLTMLPCFMADREPALRRVPPGRVLPSYEIWLLTHADLRHTARVRTFMGFIADGMERYRDLLEGKCPLVTTSPMPAGPTPPK